MAMSRAYDSVSESQIIPTEASAFTQKNHKFEHNDRTRRLIPTYMAFYIPKSNREYLPLTNEYNYKQMVIFSFFSFIINC